jgi:hypothetical protein
MLINRIDDNIPGPWRSVDLAEAGRELNQTITTGIGRHLDIMKRVSLAFDINSTFTSQLMASSINFNFFI